MGKHTPGDWIVCADGVSVHDEHITCIVAVGPSVVKLVDDDVGPDLDTQKANARLIAASPAMLRVLKKIYRASQMENAMAREDAIYDAIEDARPVIFNAGGFDE